MAQPLGRDSRAALFHLCALRDANVVTRGEDRFGRTLARVTCAGMEANAEQVRGGLGVGVPPQRAQDLPLVSNRERCPSRPARAVGGRYPLATVGVAKAESIRGVAMMLQFNVLRAISAFADRSLRSVLCACLLTFSIAAVGQNYTFSELQWGSSKASVRDTLVAAGFPTVRQDSDGDLRFDGGTLLGFKSGGWAMFSGEGLAKVQVVLLTPNNKARETYKRLRDTLRDKYGAPTQTFEYFTRPYYEGDGYEEQAIRLGKGIFSTFWEHKPTKQSIHLQITERLVVSVSYESGQWSEESERRKKRETKAF